MICYVGAASSEKQAQNALKKYNKWTSPDPANPTVDVVWNGAVAMIAGCKLIIGYQNGTDSFGNPIRTPVYHPLYWMNVVWAVPDDALYNDVATVARAPIIEFDFSRTPEAPVKPSAFVRRSANLPTEIVPLDTKLLGITPIWAGAPNMGFPYDTAV